MDKSNSYDKRLHELEKIIINMMQMKSGTTFTKNVSTLVVDILVKAGLIKVLEDVVIKDDNIKPESTIVKNIPSNATIETTGMEHKKSEVGVKLKNLLREKIDKTEKKS